MDKKLFACATYIWNEKKDCPIVGAYIVAAESREEARGFLLPVLIDKYPYRDGFGHHDVVVNNSSGVHFTV